MLVLFKSTERKKELKGTKITENSKPITILYIFRKIIHLGCL